MTNHDSEWIEHQHTRTYSIAARLASLSRSAELNYMEEFWNGHTNPEDLLPPWQKVTLVHRFAVWISHSIFLNDCDGPYMKFYEPEIDYAPRRILPVDAAMMRYGFADDPFRIRPSDGEWVEIRPRVKKWQESDKVANACYEYFTEEVMWSESYERLTLQIAEEVFHVIFNDRATLAGLNELASLRVLDVGEAEPDPKYMTRRGRLRRKSPPSWARRAVFHRDKGTCTLCDRDLTGLIDPLAVENYDHIIPLDLGGLNDITNLQLACKDCNHAKAARMLAPRMRYRRWYRTSGSPV
jgi:hypothetical protein